MHDPNTVAFEIKSPIKTKSPLFLDGYRTRLITIWHKDPEKDGTDDSCGWFMRTRHGDQKIYEDIVKEFEFNFKNNYWFRGNGMPVFSTSGIVLSMYRSALWQIVKQDSKKRDAFLEKHLHNILHFSENATDSLHTAITSEMYYRTVEHDRSIVEARDERIRSFASVVFGDIIRKMRPWYKHPRWHVHHWRFQIHPLQNLKRRYWDKCSACGKRGFKRVAYSDWNGTRIWHAECDKTFKKEVSNA